MTPWLGLACFRKADLAPADGFGSAFAGLVVGAGAGFGADAVGVLALRGPVGGVAASCVEVDLVSDGVAAASTSFPGAGVPVSAFLG